MSSQVAIKYLVEFICLSYKRVVLVSAIFLCLTTSNISISLAGGLVIPKYPIFDESVDHEPTRLDGRLNSWIIRNIQVNKDFNVSSLGGEIFDRKNNPFMGAEFYIDGEIQYESEYTFLYTDENGNPHYRVDNYQKVTPFPGDYFELTWKKAGTEEVMNTVKLVLISSGLTNGSYNACWAYTFDGSSSETWCDNRYDDYWFWFAAYGLQCLEEGNYYMELRQNGEIKSVIPFHPSEFQPTDPMLVVSKDSIQPKTVGMPNGETVEIKATLEDDIVRADVAGQDGKNCGVPIKNRNVTIVSSIRPLSGSHKHFENVEEIGTGKFTSSLPPWDSDTYKPTEITLPTDEDGEAVAEYQSGVYGVGEKIEVKVKNSSTGQEKKSEANIDIKVPGLVPLETNGYFYTLRGSYGSPCDKGHNDGPTGEKRMSHYVTQRMKNLIHRMNDLYYKSQGHNLSLNDGALEYGGFFDYGDSSDRKKRCHVSHQTGNDIDVNRGVTFDKVTNCEDVSSNSLNCYVANGKYGTRVLRWEVLDQVVEHEIKGLTKILEDTLHYRAITDTK